MKKGWTYKKLGEVCCKSSNIKWDMVSCDTSYKYIDLTSVDRDDLAIHNPQIITKENAPSRAKQIVKNGDIIFATTRPTLRRVSLINEMYDGLDSRITMYLYNDAEEITGALDDSIIAYIVLFVNTFFFYTTVLSAQ